MAFSLVHKLAAYGRVLPRAKRNRTDLARLLARRPGLALGVGAYEAGLLFSSRLDSRYKSLAALKVSALIGCPF